MSSAAHIQQAKADRQIAIWLFTVAAFVVAMVLVGGLTRLTDSGLSITEWAPIRGAIPPLTQADWLAEFDKERTVSKNDELATCLTHSTCTCTCTCTCNRDSY